MNISARAANVDDLESPVSITLVEAIEAEGIEESPALAGKGIRAGPENPAIAQFILIFS